MTKYYEVICKVEPSLEDEVAQLALKTYDSMGIEDFSIDEERVDDILGDRSYSGGDVPQTVVNEVEFVVTTDLHLKKFYFNEISNAQSFKDRILASYAINSDLKSESYKDWNTEWKKSYRPIRVSEKLEIIPEWEKESYQTNCEIPLYIYPGQGFGTGSHETTFLCLMLYSELDKNYKTCLDFGCGSGILGIGVKLAHRKMLCDLYDIDPQALENCKQNIVLNDLALTDFSLLLPKDREVIHKKYDLVFANILQNVLLEEVDYLANSLVSGGELILSGLLSGQENLVIEKYLEANSNLTHVKTESKGDWVAVLLKQVSRSC